MSAFCPAAPLEWLLVLAQTPRGGADESEAILNKESETDELNEADDATLAGRLPNDPEAFVQLYRRYYEPILNYLYRQTGNRHEAEDLTSQTFLSALQFLQRRPGSVRFRPWIYRIATNTLRSHQRSLTRRVRLMREWLRERTVNRPLSHSGADLALEREQRHAHLRQILMTLPERYRTALMLRYDEALPFAEIAQSLGIEEGSARSRVARGLKLLRERMRHHGLDR